jgi:endoglucanase
VTRRAPLAAALLPFLLAGCGGIFHSDPSVVRGGLVERHGRLRVDGLQLVDSAGVPLQLRGVSFFWPQWHEDNIQRSAMTFIVREMGATVVRIPVPAMEYAKSPATWDATMRNMVSWARAEGIYALVDWHVVDDPNNYLDDALLFWDRTARYFAGDPHVIYEISNEPTGVGWDGIKKYAAAVIPVIRRSDPTSVIVVGTPEWSRWTRFAAADPLVLFDAKGDTVRNLMYTYHGYAGTHGMAKDLAGVLQKVPVFATEWSASEASGDGRCEWDRAHEFVRFLHDNPWQKVSWTQWSWVDKHEASALLRTGSGGGPWVLSPMGDSCRSWIREGGTEAYPGFRPSAGVPPVPVQDTVRKDSTTVP